MTEWLAPPPPPIKRGQLDFAPGELVNPLDQLRIAFKRLTEEDWCELSRQLGVPDPRWSRAKTIAWLKTWMHRS